MKNIRSKVFETNSSSTHSISICADADGIYETVVPDKDGAIVLSGGKFGWDFAEYSDCLTKMNYAAIFTASPGTHNSYDKFQAEFARTRELLIQVIKEHTGAKKIVFNFTVEQYNKDKNFISGNSYIDHQSNLMERRSTLRAFESKQTLKDWLFNPKSKLETGNDNDYGEEYEEEEQTDE